MDLDLEEGLATRYPEKNFVYSLFLDGQGASFGNHNGKFFKLRYKDVIFKIWFQ